MPFLWSGRIAEQTQRSLRVRDGTKKNNKTELLDFEKGRDDRERKEEREGRERERVAKTEQALDSFFNHHMVKDCV